VLNTAVIPALVNAVKEAIEFVCICFAVYDIEEAIEFAFADWEDIFEGRSTDLTNVIRNVYSNGVEAVVDFPHSYFFDQFLEKWPKAKVKHFINLKMEDAEGNLTCKIALGTSLSILTKMVCLGYSQTRGRQHITCVDIEVG